MIEAKYWTSYFNARHYKEYGKVQLYGGSYGKVKLSQTEKFELVSSAEVSNHQFNGDFFDPAKSVNISTALFDSSSWVERSNRALKYFAKVKLSTPQYTKS